MKHIKRILIMFMALGLCAACSSPAGNSAAGSVQTESVTESAKEEETPAKESVKEEEETASGQKDDTAAKVNVGIVTWSWGTAEEAEFSDAVQKNLSGQYQDLTGEIFTADAQKEASMLPMIVGNIIAKWEGSPAVILIVDNENGFSDEDLLSIMKDAEKADMIVGVNHAVDSAPANSFVYDASDAESCASSIVENIRK